MIDESSVGTVTRRPGGNGRWWMAFALALAAVITYSVVAGNYIAGMREPEYIGHSRVGEWADLSEYGFRIRADGIDLLDEMPGSYDPTQVEVPPAGMKFLRVLFTVEALVPPDGDLGCQITVSNGDGEDLGLTEIGVAGPNGTQCTHFDGREGIEVGDTFQTQVVHVVLPAPVESFTITVDPLYTDDLVLWTISA